ncbi:DUF4145 domain-containing protein [Aurantimonas litoralis]|nr:DUF4145 domain-containing protein [Aurantimonas litoralis]
MNSYDSFHLINVGAHKLGEVGLRTQAISCSNADCRDIFLHTALIKSSRSPSGGSAPSGEPISSWQLRPYSLAKPQPECVPKALVDDYEEACLIRELSPKASATLSRRCLQGMIRDFCDIRKRTLFEEVNELRRRLDKGTAPQGVEHETVEAFDAVREVGNIGAHMERDINVIIDVDPGEAQTLIELIEMLFDEWYVARHKRRQRLARVKDVAEEKNAAKTPRVGNDVEPPKELSSGRDPADG